MGGIGFGGTCVLGLGGAGGIGGRGFGGAGGILLGIATVSKAEHSFFHQFMMVSMCRVHVEAVASLQESSSHDLIEESCRAQLLFSASPLQDF